MNTSYLEKHNSSIVLTKSFEEIFLKIKGDELSSIVDAIRKEPDKTKRKAFKSGLSGFFPTLLLNNTSNKLNDDSDATGIVQFDVDTQDNPDLDFDSLKAEISTLPEIFYIFKSPSGGLKFGVKTDFNRHENEEIESFKARFKIAYEKVESFIDDALFNFNVAYDKNVANIKWLCYLSHDTDVYYNLDCVSFKVDALCIYEKPEIRLTSNQDEDKGQVLELLSYISKDLDYDDRFKVNTVVIDALGSAALFHLESHWTTNSRGKLRKDIEGQIRQLGKSVFKANLGTLVNYAKANDWYAVTGAARNKLSVRESSSKLTDLLDSKEASIKLNEIIKDFFADGKSRFINFSTGAGKTYTMLQILEDFGRDKKIVYLVKTHELAEEIKHTFDSIRNERSKTRSFKEKLHNRSSIDHLKGRALLCENDSVIKEKVPSEFCAKDLKRGITENETCMFQAECKYTKQFDQLGSIRVMTHNEYVNYQAKFFNGVDGSGEVRKGKWVADYLIIDEDIFTVEKDYKEEVKGRFEESIKAIVFSVEHGLDLKDAILNHQGLIFDDALQNVMNSKREFKRKLKSKSKKEPQFSELFHNITQYAKTENLQYLNGMRVEKLTIIQSVIKPVADRYKNTSTLYLDATANQAIIERLRPNVEYHSISVKSKHDINLYQLQNKNFSKQQLKTEGVMDAVIFGLKKLAKKYQDEGESVGLITHKTLKDITDTTEYADFDEFLSNETGIELYGHFGGLRGLNKFNDVDCLIILSRQQIPPSAVHSNTWAIFNEAGETWTKDGVSYIDSDVRMKNGSVAKLNSQITLNEKTRSVKDHYSLSETKQAIGRGRMVHGKSKDIYFLSNEYIGSDIEFSGFLNYEDLFVQEQDIINADQLEKLKAVGFIEDKQVEIMRVFGLTKSKVQQNKEEIISEVKSAGFYRVEVNFTKINRKKASKKFFTCNEILLREHLIQRGDFKKLNSFISIE